ncbi:MAG: transposase [bacterium]
MNNISPQTRLEVVQHYLNNGDSLRKTAKKFQVYYPTVFKWVKLYKEQGEQRLLSNYKRPWNRVKKELEEKIALLKEKNPSLTVRETKEILGKQKMKISIKGIWGVWKRYGYAGFIKEEFGHDFTGYIAWSKEAKSKFEVAKKVFESGKIIESAKILNSIPSLPTNKLIGQISDKLLNWKRKTEKMSCLMGEIPPHSYVEKGKKLYKELKRRKLYHSALRIGIMEIVALTWIAPSEKTLKKIEEVRQIINSPDDHHTPNNLRRTSELLFGPRFSLLIEEGIECTRLMKLKKAYEIAEICRRLLRTRKSVSPLSVLQLGIMYMNLEDYRKAENLILPLFKKVDEEGKKQLKVRLANIFVTKGDWRTASRFSSDAEFGAWSSLSGKYLFFSRLALIKGDLQKAISLCIEILSQLKEEKFEQRIFSAVFTIASAYAGLGERIKAKKMLTKILPFFKKRKLKKYIHIIEILLSPNRLKLKNKKSKARNQIAVINFLSPFPDCHLNKDLLPSVKLVHLIRNGNYLKALSFAKKKYLMLHFYRYLFFFPETIIRLLEKGKSTGLPRVILKLPIFNKEVPVYHIKFLGSQVVYKNQKYLEVKLPPKNTAFIIQLATKTGGPGEKIYLKDLYNNFWPRSKGPSRNLSHLLMRVKKALKISSHLLTISSKTGCPSIINEGIYFTTDYQEFEQILAQAKALERVGEWRFAKREYLRAFKLFRGEPFKKMYDNWSEQMRRVILGKLEDEAVHFVKSCLEHKNKTDARKVLKRVLKIMPDSEEITILLKSLIAD